MARRGSCCTPRYVRALLSASEGRGRREGGKERGREGGRETGEERETKSNECATRPDIDMGMRRIDRPSERSAARARPVYSAIDPAEPAGRTRFVVYVLCIPADPRTGHSKESFSLQTADRYRIVKLGFPPPPLPPVGV